MEVLDRNSHNALALGSFPQLLLEVVGEGLSQTDRLSLPSGMSSCSSRSSLSSCSA